MSTDYVQVVLPAFGIGETLTLAVYPEWIEELEKLRPLLVYGPDYSRAIPYNLRDMTLFVTRGDRETAEVYFKACVKIRARRENLIAKARAWLIENLPKKVISSRGYTSHDNIAQMSMPTLGALVDQYHPEGWFKFQHTVNREFEESYQ